MMNGNSQAIEQYVSDILGENHVRISVELKSFTDLDNTSRKAIDYWKRETLLQVINKADKWTLIENFLEK